MVDATPNNFLAIILGSGPFYYLVDLFLNVGLELQQSLSYSNEGNSKKK